jgi:hypothetical protein
VHAIRSASSSSLCLALALGLLLGPFAAYAQAPLPEPFVASYSASYRGIEAGNLTFSLERDQATGNFIYETTADPSFLARLVVSNAALERSEMQIDDSGVRPLNWHLDDGKSGDKGDGTLRFDWADQTVTGTIEREQIKLPTQPGLQDRLSIQILVMTALLRGEEPGTIPLIDDNRVKQYTYAKTGTATMDTALGRIETVIYESTRQGSSRVARFWMAPTLGYIPVRAEQERKGKMETVMMVKGLKREPR